jgi:hypothetical protein
MKLCINIFHHVSYMYAKLYNFLKLLNTICGDFAGGVTSTGWEKHYVPILSKKTCHHRIQNLSNSLLSNAILSLSG